MKSFLSLISVSFALALAFTACSDNASDKEAKVDGDTTSAITEEKADGNQQKAEANKKLVTEFYQAFFGDKDTSSVDKYVSDNIVEHSPILKDGKGYLKDLASAFYTNPNIEKTKVDIKHIAADGDMVWLMAKDVAPNGKVFARVDIFRVENDKIAEHWVISQAVPKESENKNTMF